MGINKLLVRTYSLVLRHKAFFIGFMFSLSLASYLTNFNLIDQASYSSMHQSINAWKLYQIEKSNLNILHYDVILPDLSGGRFVSYWDTPLPYLVGTIIAKLLLPFGGLRFLVAVKLVTLINFSLTYLVFWLILRELRVKPIISAVVIVFFQSHRIALDTLYSLNMSGVWSLILPIYLFLILRRSRSVRLIPIIFFSIAISFLQNPYYGVFSLVFLSIPLALIIFKFFLASPGSTSFSLVIGILVLFIPVITLKGLDLFLIQKLGLSDPQGRNYTTMQVQSYRFWHHLMPNSGSVFADYVNPPINKILNWTKRWIDEYTIWYPPGNNTSYLGVANVLIFLFLLCMYSKDRGLNFVIKFLPFVASFIVGALIFFRGDFYFQGYRHPLPWYRLQLVSPLRTTWYYSILAAFLFYMLIAVFTSSALKRGRRILTLVVLILMLVFIKDVTGYAPASCKPLLDGELFSYLKSSEKRRLHIYLASHCDTDINPWSVLSNQGLQRTPIIRDGRFYQIFHNTPIFAPGGLSWFDNYDYGQATSYRNLESVLTEKNDLVLKSLGIDEVVYWVDGLEGGDEYWSKFKAVYSRRQKARFFKLAVVISLVD